MAFTITGRLSAMPFIMPGIRKIVGEREGCSVVEHFDSLGIQCEGREFKIARGVLEEYALDKRYGDIWGRVKMGLDTVCPEWWGTLM